MSPRLPGGDSPQAAARSTGGLLPQLPPLVAGIVDLVGKGCAAALSGRALYRATGRWHDLRPQVLLANRAQCLMVRAALAAAPSPAHRDAFLMAMRSACRAARIESDAALRTAVRRALDEGGP